MNWRSVIVSKKLLFTFIIISVCLITLWSYTPWGTLPENVVGAVGGAGTTIGAARPSGAEPISIRAARQCIEASHLKQSLNLQMSLENSQYLYDEYRKVIPQQSLEGYPSHCWRTSYSVTLMGSDIEGYIGNRTFEKRFKKRDEHIWLILKRLRSILPSRRFKSDIMCVPNMFLAGFPKCGSTYLYCIMSRLIDYATKRPRSHHEAMKEPHFWVSGNEKIDVRVPSSEDVLGYFLNFLPLMKTNSKNSKSQVLLVDGSPNMFFKWPRFRARDNLANYCLIPSVLPNLLPNSKYIVIMRNPVKMMYSSFWFSCTSWMKIPLSVQLKGPNLFHDRVVEKLTKFNKCMRDTSVPELSYTCLMDSKQTYSSCIMERLHLLDKCIHQIAFNNFSPELPSCGRTRLAMGVYYVHIRKWLSVVAKDRFLFLTLEDLILHSNSVMNDIHTFLGLHRDDRFDNIISDIHNSCNTNPQRSVDYKNNPRLKMRKETETLLNTFFYPFNVLLSKLINKSNPWNM